MGTCGGTVVKDECDKCGGTGKPSGACNCAGDVTGCDGVCGSGKIFDVC